MGWGSHSRAQRLTEERWLCPTWTWKPQKAAAWQPCCFSGNLHRATFMSGQSRPDGSDSRVKFHRRDRTSEIRPWICWRPPSDAQPPYLSDQSVQAQPTQPACTVPRSWGLMRQIEVKCEIGPGSLPPLQLRLGKESYSYTSRKTPVFSSVCSSASRVSRPKEVPPSRRIHAIRLSPTPEWEFNELLGSWLGAEMSFAT